MCDEEDSAGKEGQDLELGFAEEREVRRKVEIASAMDVDECVSHGNLYQVRGSSTHTKNPATLPNPNILPAQALPSSC
jgi:hypothetical protein